MEKNEFDTPKLIQYWVASSDEDFETMKSLLQNKRYSWALFVGHLMIEKLMKAYFSKIRNTMPPFIHNLLRLAELSGMELNEDLKLFFATVSAFNINARYDDYKLSFQKKCTPEFTKEWVQKMDTQRLWIKELIEQ